MDEEKKNKPSTQNNDNGIQPEANSFIEQTDKRIERLETANKKTEELINKQEEIYMKQKLGGTTDGPVESKPKFTDEEKASRARIKAVGDVNNSGWAKKYE